MINAQDIIAKIIDRKLDSNKNDFGRVLVVAGSEGMLGAGALASKSALVSGSGLVYWAVPKELKNFANLYNPETIILSFEEIEKYSFDAAIIGPGLTTGEAPSSIIKKLLSTFNKPIVVDACALRYISSNIKQLESFDCSKMVFTPHPGEMGLLLGLPTSEIQKNREELSAEFAAKYKLTLVLKGSNTIVANLDGNIFINTTGNPGMATAGMGDVLCGIIASFVGQGLSSYDAAVAGTYIHGLSGDIAVKSMGYNSLIASDVIKYLPEGFLQIKNGI